MKAFVAILALIAAVVGDVSIQQPNSRLQPPVENQSSKDFNGPWVEENTWTPSAGHQQPMNVAQQSAYFTQVQHDNNNQGYQYLPPQKVEDAQQGSYYAPEQQSNFNQNYQHQYQPQQQVEVVHQSSCYTPEQQNNNNNNQAYQHHHYQQQDNQQQQGHYQSHNAPSSVAFQVTHPDWAMSYSNVNRYNNYWSAAPASPVMFVPTTQAFAAATASFSKPSTQAPVAVYNNNVAKWNTWNNNQHSRHQPSLDLAKVPLPVAKYIAITPGSIHIAPLPGHTVSHKFLNVASAGSW